MKWQPKGLKRRRQRLMLLHLWILVLKHAPNLSGTYLLIALRRCELDANNHLVERWKPEIRQIQRTFLRVSH